MILLVDTDAMRRLAQRWDESAEATSRGAATVAGVRGGAENFGRLNQFLTPALRGFTTVAEGAVRRSAEQWADGALAARDTALDVESTDDAVARGFGSAR